MACLIGGPLVDAASPTQQAFIVARYLAGFHRSLYTPLFIGSVASLRAVVEGAVAFIGAKTPSNEMSEAVAACMRTQLHQHERDELQHRVGQLLGSLGSVDVHQALMGAQVTAARVALLACDDIAVACKEASRSPPRDESIGADDLVREILSFWSSSAFGAVRVRLGLAH